MWISIKKNKHVITVDFKFLNFLEILERFYYEPKNDGAKIPHIYFRHCILKNKCSHDRGFM